MNSGVTNGFNGFIDGIVTNVDKFFKSKEDGQSIPLVYVGVSATISIIDTPDHGPAIKIQATEMDNHSTAVIGGALGERPGASKNQSTLPFKIIPLSMVETVSAGWSLINDPTAGGVKIFGSAPSNGGFLGGSGDELLRFDTLGGGGNAFQPNRVGVTPNQFSDDVIAGLRSLVEWNRQRIAIASEKQNKTNCRIGSQSSSDYATMK